ncbi:amidohydrolase family protein [Actinopolyspora sp. H202]|uniref:amidohydrolase family protein n=1 Tax=Actinopolyspora sp. H202 TaxID=1500456 RepID=UPI003EE75649
MFDSHLHIIDPRFPVAANQGYVPPPFTVNEYTTHTAHLDVTGGAVVSGSFQEFDQEYLCEALARLGPGFVGVTQLPADVTNERILELHHAGVRAVRFNARRGGGTPLDQLDALARRVHEIAGWHVECYVDARELHELAPTLASLPAISVDHLGLNAEGLDHLLRLVERGARVKATGFGRFTGDVPTAMRAIVDVNENALMFGTDLPSTRAPRPFRDSDITLVRETFEESQAKRVLHDNAVELYRPPAFTDLPT